MTNQVVATMAKNRIDKAIKLSNKEA